MSVSIKSILRKVKLSPFWLMIIGILLIPLFIYLFIKLDFFPTEVSIINLITILSIITALLLISFRAFLNYLTPTDIAPPGPLFGFDDDADYTLEDVIKELRDVKQEIHKIGTVKVDLKDVDKSQLLNTLKLSTEQSLKDQLFKSIDESFVKRDLQNKQWERLVIGFDDIRKRLYEETNNLARRSNLNLALGSLTTVVAGVGLIVIVLLRPLDLTGLTSNEYAWRLIAHYIPRFSIIIFAEIFAYFFLRLYKVGLADIKFYQNELSNVEMKLAALKAAFVTQDNEIIKLVISELSRTERNFILKKEETTVDLEKFKAENITAKDVLENLSVILKSK